MGQHDLSYRLFFSHRRMIQDLLREIVGEQWVSRIDFDSGERVNASFVSHKHQNRESDVIWKFRRNDGKAPVYIYILMEFQSRPDPSMPVRLMSYESLFYQSLLAGLPTAAWNKLPPVIPLVVYNGEEPWNVATDLGSLIGDLDARVHRLRRTVPPAEASLRRAFETWLHKVILPRFGISDEGISATVTLEGLETMLAESIDRRHRQIREEGRQEGEARLVLRLLHLKFGPLAPDIEERVRSADADRLLDWGERVLTAERLQDVFRD